MGKPNINVNVSGPVQPTSTYKTKVLKGNHSFASQVTEPNMKYVIKHDFDLGGESVTIPANCILEFDGSSIKNGRIYANNTFIKGNKGIFDTSIKIDGKIANCELYSSWITGNNDSEILNCFFNILTDRSSTNLQTFIVDRNYNVDSTVYVGEPDTNANNSHRIRIKGIGCNKYPCSITSDNPITILRIYSKAVDISDIRISFNSDYRGDNDAVCIYTQRATSLDITEDSYPNAEQAPSEDVVYTRVITNNGYYGFKLTGNNFYLYECSVGNCRRGISLNSYTNIEDHTPNSETSRYIQIINCTSHAGNKNQIFIENAGERYISQILVQGCHNSSAGTFISGNFDNLNFTGNIVDRCDKLTGEIVGNYKNTIFANNVFVPRTTTEYLIPFIFEAIDNIMIVSNIIDHCGGAFVQAEYATNITISNNQVKNWKEMSYPVKTIRSETAAGNYTHVLVSSYQHICLGYGHADTCENIQISNNIFINDTGSSLTKLPIRVYTDQPNKCVFSNNIQDGLPGAVLGGLRSIYNITDSNKSDYYAQYLSGTKGALCYFYNLKKLGVFDTDKWCDVLDGVDIRANRVGKTSERPAGDRISVGFRYYDKTLKKPIYASSIVNSSPYTVTWLETDGATAGVARSGETASRPTGSNIYVGFMFMDTTLGKPIYASAINGDTVTWVDATGTPVS